MPYSNETGEYTPPAVSGFFPTDLYEFGKPFSGAGAEAGKPEFTARVVDRTPDGDIVFWRAILRSAHGGLNRTIGDFERDFDRSSSSTLDTRWYRSLILPQLTTNTATPDPGGTLVGMHSVNVMDRLWWGIGSSANAALFVETSATDPTPSAITYTPTGSICSLSAVKSGSATVARMLAVGRTGSNAAQLISDVTGTVNTTMHTDTCRCWGIIQTCINNNQLLIYSNGAIRYLDSTVAATTQPTLGLSDVPDGGYALGMAKLSGAPIRPYWWWPYEDNDNGNLLSSAEKPGRVVSTNQEGTDYQEIPLGLKYIFSSCVVNNSAIAASDKERVVIYDGRAAPRDVPWIIDREADSDRVYECRGLFANGPELWIRVNHKAASGATSGTNTNIFWEVYNIETNAIHRVSGTYTAGSTGSYGNLPGGSMPFSQTTGFAQTYEDGSWRRIFVPVFGYNPYTLYRQTGSAASGTGNEYESTGTWTSPEWELPGLEGWPKYVSRIMFLGDVDSGGTASTAAVVNITAGNMTAQYDIGHSGRAQLADLTDNAEMFYKLQVEIQLTRTTASTRFTPNGLPVVIEGYAFIKNNQPPYGFYEDVR